MSLLAHTALLAQQAFGPLEGVGTALAGWAVDDPDRHRPKPPVVDGVSVDSPAERWRAAYEAYFPSKGLKAGVADLSMVEAEQFAEEAVDEMRRQKKMELERMRKEMEQEQLLSEGRK